MKTNVADSKQVKLSCRNVWKVYGSEPDKFFKGSDYKNTEIPESKIVQSYGGEVVFIDLIEGHSTTSTINQIKKIPSD